MHSVHLGVVFDLDMETFFSTSFSDLSNNPSRNLTSGNKWSVDTYIKFVNQQIQDHNIERRLSDLYTTISANLDNFSDDHFD